MKENMYREIDVISDFISFKDGYIEISAKEVYIRIPHTASFNDLNEIKTDIFPNNGYSFKLKFDGNMLIDDDKAKKFLSKIEKAKEIYKYIVVSDPEPTPKPKPPAKNTSKKINKKEYIKFLTSMQHDNVAQITISEERTNEISDSILFQLKTKSNDTLFIWESAKKISKATYIFITNDNHYTEILNRVQSYLQAKNFDNKRAIIKNNLFVQRWLCYVTIVPHTDIDTYVSCIKKWILEANFSSQHFCPALIVHKNHDLSNIVTNTAFDSLLYHQNSFYVVDPPLLKFDKEITVRAFKQADNKIIYIQLIILYNLLEAKNQILFYDEELTNLSLPYRHHTTYAYNKDLHRRPISLNSKYIGFHFFFEKENKEIIKRSMIIESSTLLKLSNWRRNEA